MLLSCKDQSVSTPNPETLITQRSDTLTMIVSQNGRKSYRFETPLLERYELAREPYMEFTQGIFLETFKDSTEEIESTIIADYAIRYENRQRWEARGNVVATGVEGRTLYTEQLFWDEKTERVFSNVTSKIVQGDDVFVGERFVSDDKLQNWTFLNYEGQVGFDASPNDGSSEQQPGEQDPSAQDEAQTPQIPATNEQEAQPADTTTAPPAVQRPTPAPAPSERPVSGQRVPQEDASRMLRDAPVRMLETEPAQLKAE